MLGQVVSHYRIVDKLGSGGMGVVYKGEDTRLGRPVAIKILPKDWATDPVSLERFHAEARTASALNHPNICTIYDIGEHEGAPFIVMELLEGATLRELIHSRPVSLDELVSIGIQITSALDAAHSRGIVHRDVKPANIFVTHSGQAKLLDFGLAKLTAERDGLTGLSATVATRMTTTGATVGTVAYMSPEQARAEELDPRTDLFSMGLVLYEMATGQEAFAGPSAAVVFDSILNRKPAAVSVMNPNLPVALELTIDKALEKDRRFRYQHSGELRTDLERIKRDWSSGAQLPVAGPRGALAQDRTVTVTAAPVAAKVEEDVGGKRPGLAFMLGFIPGAGALYNADYRKAFIHIGAFTLLTAVNEQSRGGFIGDLVGPLLFALFVYMPFEAYHSAKKRKSRT